MIRNIGMIAVLVLTAACTKSQPAESKDAGVTTTTAATQKAEPTAKVDAEELFKTRCAQCHGETGKGNGPGAAALNPKPRNYTDPAWQAKVTDDDIKKTIVYGGAAVGKSPNMPANPDLEDKPEELDGLVQVIRQFKGK